MSKTIIDGVALDASGGADPDTTGRFEKEIGDDVVLHLVGDADTSDVTVSLNGVKLDVNDSNFVTPQTTESHSNVDATTDANNETAMRFVETDGYEVVEFLVENNAASATTVTVNAEGY